MSSAPISLLWTLVIIIVVIIVIVVLLRLVFAVIFILPYTTNDVHEDVKAITTTGGLLRIW
jgi:hypothetical protein